jgi:hypothetical protein
MIITAVSHVGDFLRAVPVLWHRYQITKQPYTFLFTKNYKPYTVIEELLYLQEFTKHVDYIDVGTNASNPNDYEINPADYGYAGEYVNLHLNYSLAYSISSHYGNLIGYAPDYSFRYKLPAVEEKHKKYTDCIVSISDENKGNRWTQFVSSDIELTYLSMKNSLIDNIMYAKHAKNVIIPSNLFAHVLEFCDIDCTVYFDSSISPKLLHINQNVIQI